MRQSPLLCVDDEPNNLAILREILQGQYPLVFARNGADALRLADKHRPGLVLLDVQMPGMDGYEVCARLKASPATEDVPVIFVSALAQEANEKRGFDCGGVDYITKPISPAIVRARVKTHLSLVRLARLERSHRDAVYMLGMAGHFNDNDTGAHIWRMGAYSRVLAQALGWPEGDCELIELAAAMHDTGKLGVPHNILKKPEKLSPDEFEAIKKHPHIGFDILSHSDAPLFRLAAEIALHHHERWDGKGYPLGLSGAAIPESARIVAVADVFDALTMARPYKQAWPAGQALAFVQDGAGSHFDPRAVEAFAGAFPRILEIKRNWALQEEPAPGD